MLNPYLDYFLTLPPGCRRHPAVPIDPWSDSDPAWLEFKHAVTGFYSWAVPTEAAIEAVARWAGRVVEIGAGSGYWACLMARAGIDVVAYDARPPAATWHPVLLGDEMVAARHRDRTLFLCWPPFGTDMAHRALIGHGGDQVVYVGEWLGGSATAPFFDVLARAFEQVAEVELPQWSMRTDRLTIHRRR